MNRRLHKIAIRPMTRPQRGFSFFEVLIAALILGVAVLGFASLQIRAIGSTGEAALRSQAAMLAGELVERIRMADTGVAGNNRTSYEVATLWTAPDPLPNLPWTIGDGTNGTSCIYTAAASVNTAPVVGVNACAEVQMVRADALEIRLLAEQLLPGGTVAVRPCPSGGGPSATLTCVHVGWRGQDARIAGVIAGGCELGELHPNCFSMQGFF